jgi:hypothetical protein
MHGVRFYYILSTFSSAIPLITGFFYFAKLKLDLKIFLGLLFFATVFGTVAFFLVEKGYNAYWLMHVYVPIEFSLFVIIFSLWQERQLFRKFMAAIIPLFLGLCVYDVLDTVRLQHNVNLTESVACIILAGISSLTLIDIEKKAKTIIIGDYRFWISSGLLIYSAGSLAYFAFFPSYSSIVIFVIYTSLNILSYLIYTIGIICQGRLRT